MLSVINQLYEAINNDILKLVAIAIVTDTVFGVVLSIKERKFNSSFGIDGAIRKVSMLLCITFCIIVDIVIHLNFIGFLPNDVLKWLNESLHIGQIGLGAFFGVIFISYEVVSILKNMTLCGLPTKRVYENVRKFLEKYTNELPSEAQKGDVENEDSEQDA